MEEIKMDIKKYALGVDIGGTKIFIMMATQFGEVIYKKKVESTGDLSKIANIIDAFIDESKIERDQIFGMGIGVPGEVNSISGVVRVSVQMGWKNTDVKGYFSKHYSFPVYVKNDVNCSALGERWIGNGNNSDHIAYISIGTGLGGAIIANGQLVEGYSFSGGEFGYIVNLEDSNEDQLNNLDEFGCLERRISGYYLTEKSKAVGFGARDLFTEYAKGNVVAEEIVKPFIKYLSILIANLISMLNPEYVIIGGGVSESMNEILDPIIEKVQKMTIFPATIKLSKLGGAAGALGCIYHVFDKSRVWNISEK